MDVNVIPVPEPVVHISGTSDISREYEDFKLGVRIFADVHIVMTTGSPTGNGNIRSPLVFSKTLRTNGQFSGEPVNGIENRLDHCSISVSPPLNPDHESIDVPDDLLHQLSVLGQVSADGVEFSGAEMIYNYERVLRQVTYSNKKPAYYLNRQFRITCSELNGRFVSNEYMQTVSYYRLCFYDFSGLVQKERETHTQKVVNNFSCTENPCYLLFFLVVCVHLDFFLHTTNLTFLCGHPFVFC